MNDPIDGMARYKRQTRELLVRRALGLLTLEDEGEMAEILDDTWRTLSEDQQQEIEQWLTEELQPAPNKDLHQAAADVEAEDITVAPRSAA